MSSRISGLSEFEAAELEKTFYQHDRNSVRELATLWDPDIPTVENAAYIERARQLEKDLKRCSCRSSRNPNRTPADQPPVTPASAKVAMRL